MTIFLIWYGSSKQHIPNLWLRHVGYADIIWVLGAFFGHVYSTFGICISIGFLLQFATLGCLACLPLRRQNDIYWSRKADRGEEWEESGELFWKTERAFSTTGMEEIVYYPDIQLWTDGHDLVWYTKNTQQGSKHHGTTEVLDVPVTQYNKYQAAAH